MIKSNELAPIALFTFNRPKHTQIVLDNLALNPESEYSNLFIFCDGPKMDTIDDEILKIEQVRKIAYSEKRFKNVKVFIQEQNKGLASSIIDGVTELVNRFGKVIVLEDDILVSNGFLLYMNEALRVYEYSNKVMHISGWVFPFHNENYKLDTFFHKPCSCWGWATWKRSWDCFEKNPEKQIKEMDRLNKWDEFTIFGTYPSFRDQVYQNFNGSINTWAIFWYLSVFLKNGTSLHPTISMVQNIGFDGSGVNNGNWDVNNPYIWNKLAEFIPVKKKYFFNSNRENRLLIKSYTNKILHKSESKTTQMNQLHIYILKILKYFYKKILKVYCYFFKRKLDNLENTNIENRYRPGEIIFYGNQFKYLDKSSYDFIFHELFINNIYKFETDNDSPYIIDCGANIGLSIVYFKRNFPNSKILAFEADPRVYNILDENISKFNYNNVELLNYALWDEEVEISFYSEGADAGRIEVNSDTNLNTVNCKTIRLSPFLNQKVDLLKIDIEGAEIKVLNESKNMLKNVDKLFVEFHSFKDKKQELSTLINILEDNNFRYYICNSGAKMERPFIKIDDYLGVDNSLNIFAYRN